MDFFVMLPSEAGAPGNHGCVSPGSHPVFRAGRIFFLSLVPWLFKFPASWPLGSQDSPVLLARLPVSLDHLSLVAAVFVFLLPSSQKEAPIYSPAMLRAAQASELTWTMLLLLICCVSTAVSNPSYWQARDQFF